MDISKLKNVEIDWCEVEQLAMFVWLAVLLVVIYLVFRNEIPVSKIINRQMIFQSTAIGAIMLIYFAYKKLKEGEKIEDSIRCDT